MNMNRFGLSLLAILAMSAYVAAADQAIDARAIAQSLLVLKDGANALLIDADPASPKRSAEGNSENDLIDPHKAGDEVFLRINQAALDYIRSEDRHPAVRFSCSVHPIREEDALVQALADPDAGLRLQALSVLIRACAPSSIVKQWQCLGELRKISGPSGWSEALGEIAKAFDPASVDQGLQTVLAAPDSDERYKDCSPRCGWSIRAAGVIGRAEAIPALSRLAQRHEIFTSLAAERSLEEIPGAAADDALVACLLSWQYNAYVFAGNALLKRNPKLLDNVLVTATVPDDCRWKQGLLLAGCGDPRAVPLLCATVGSRTMIDRAMFSFISSLAGVEHRDLVEGLPGHVRPEQREMAEQAVIKYHKRLVTVK